MLYVIIPAFNEQENIKTVIDSWYRIIQNTVNDQDFRMVVIDDGSTDRTFDCINDMTVSFPNLIPITRENHGHGPTVLYGYKYAINNHAEWIFQTDSDGQTDPDEFEQFWNNRASYDAIIGNRVKRGDGRGRIMVEKVVCFMLRLFFGVKVIDANAPFRLMKASLIDKYIDRLPSNYNIPNIMFTSFFLFYHEKVIFLPISFRARVGGKNSINLIKIFRIGCNALFDFWRFKRDLK